MALAGQLQQHCGHSCVWATLLGEQLLQCTAFVCLLPSLACNTSGLLLECDWVCPYRPTQPHTAPWQRQPGPQALGTCSTFVVACSMLPRQLLKTLNPCLFLWSVSGGRKWLLLLALSAPPVWVCLLVHCGVCWCHMTLPWVRPTLLCLCWEGAFVKVVHTQPLLLVAASCLLWGGWVLTLVVWVGFCDSVVCVRGGGVIVQWILGS
jgi:hypothetical protein